MKICSGCGSQLDENVSICTVCNEAVNDMPDFSDVRLLSQQSVLDTVRGCAKSPLLLAAIVLFTVVTLVNILMTFIPSGADVLIYAYNDYGLDMSEGEALTPVGVLTSLISVLPFAAITVGMWMSYAFATSKKAQISTAGLRVIKVGVIASIVMLVLTAVALAFSVTDLLEAVDELIDSAFSEDTLNYDPVAGWAVIIGLFAVLGKAILIASLGFTAVIIVLVVIFCIKAIGTVNTIKSTIEQGEVTGKISMFVAVMLIVLGALSLFVMTGGPILLIYGLAQGLSLIFFGVVLLIYRKRTLALMKTNQ